MTVINCMPCITHEEHLCAKTPGSEHVMTTEVSAVNLIKSNGLSHCHF
jgi:hypothetical protein